MDRFFFSHTFAYHVVSPLLNSRGWAMLTKEINNNETPLVEQENFDQHLQRLSEISVQALDELAEMIETGNDFSEE
ncbi:MULTISPECIES: hypothetical protein [Vibrio]|jgi:hypothetical protein|uniref:Uncharacterized protein n=2 Tax=Vibrio jasicida TaxID=766224 RepID=A0ABW7J5V1_9VIBR|nr:MULTISPECIES: hypothetical protein [Vibrio]MCF6452158.1 hypothetical protein [Vibrio sp. MMG023]UQA52433.1 hypothetical protein ITG12_05695 [Vibrio sp. ED002]